MKIFGTDMKKEEILKRVGDISQLVEFNHLQYIDGASKGVRAISLKCPSGLDMTVLIDRGMDISRLFYNSIPFGWKSAVDITSPEYFDDRPGEWLKSFYGGLLNTFINDSPRISNTGAKDVFVEGVWDNNKYIVRIQGKIRDAKVLGNKIEITRKMLINTDEPKIIMEDIIENIGQEISPISVLYHVNLGFPIIDSYSKILEPQAEIIPKDEEAKRNLADYLNFSEPKLNAKEQNIIHDISKDKSGYVNISIVNERFNNNKGIGFWLRYSKNTLPYLIHWKQMGGPEYVGGISPTNDFCRGIDIEKKEGFLNYIEPNEKIKYKLEFIILKSNEEIEVFRNNYCK